MITVSFLLVLITATALFWFLAKKFGLIEDPKKIVKEALQGQLSELQAKLLELETKRDQKDILDNTLNAQTEINKLNSEIAKVQSELLNLDINEDSKTSK